MDRNQLDTGLAALQAAAENGNPAARQKILMEKANAGTISPQENDELIKSLGGAGSLTDAVTAPFENDTISKSLDVSDFLRENNDALTKSLVMLADQIEKGQGQDHTFRLAVAGTLVDVTNLVKSLSDRVDALMGTPARPVISKGTIAPSADPVEKSIAGQPAAGEQLSKSQVLDYMEAIAQNNDGVSKSGENMLTAITKYETTTALSPALATEVRELHIQSKQSA